jgi:hypothetical protein
MKHNEIVLSIILTSGVLGGLTNFYLALTADIKDKECRFLFFKSLLLGICASATVPLFLQIISNNLLDVPSQSTFPEKNYFILGGFCVLASFYSKRYLDDLYTKVSRIEKVADEAKQIAENTEEKNQEIDNLEDVIPDMEELKSVQILDSREDIKKIIRSIVLSKYSYRTISGVAKETGFDQLKVKRILNLLNDRGYAQIKKNRKGYEVWRIVDKN